MTAGLLSIRMCVSLKLVDLTRFGSQAQVSSPRRVDEVEVVVEVKVEQR